MFLSISKKLGDLTFEITLVNIQILGFMCISKLSSFKTLNKIITVYIESPLINFKVNIKHRKHGSKRKVR